MNERVAKGVALLDEKVPGWRDKINVLELDIGDPNRCILGQLYGGDWLDGLYTLGLDWMEITNHGFASDEDQEAWIEVLSA